MNFTTANPNGPAVQIALVTGHTAIVPPASEVPEGVPLEVHFRREALARGCIPVGLLVDEAPADPAFDRRQVIVDAIQKLLDGDDPGAFTNDGKPDLRKLNSILGFQLDRSERDAIWADFEAAM